eukprot:2081299-Lingulodinium_polyedra.AAC.1
MGRARGRNTLAGLSPLNPPKPDPNNSFVFPPGLLAAEVSEEVVFEEGGVQLTEALGEALAA